MITSFNFAKDLEKTPTAEVSAYCYGTLGVLVNRALQGIISHPELAQLQDELHVAFMNRLAPLAPEAGSLDGGEGAPTS